MWGESIESSLIQLCWASANNNITVLCYSVPNNLMHSYNLFGKFWFKKPTKLIVIIWKIAERLPSSYHHCCHMTHFLPVSLIHHWIATAYNHHMDQSTLISFIMRQECLSQKELVGPFLLMESIKQHVPVSETAKNMVKQITKVVL